MPPGTAPVVEALGPHSATIAFAEESMVALFDELYRGLLVESEPVKAKWKKSGGGFKPIKRTIHREEEVKGTIKQVPHYIYDVEAAMCSFLARRTAPDSKLLKLFREGLFAVVRAADKAKEPYRLTAKDATSGVGQKVWASLAKAKPDGLSSSTRFGVQEDTAEGTAFLGRPEENL